jgi:hypothetical protein
MKKIISDTTKILITDHDKINQNAIMSFDCVCTCISHRMHADQE